jgi:integrase/recombinase XerC
MEFADALHRFDNHMAATGLAPKTRDKYVYQLTIFWCRFVVREGLDLLTLDEDHVNEYLENIRTQGHQHGDAARSLKAFFHWAAGRLRENDPTAEVRIPRPKLGPAPDLPDDELRALLRAAFRREPRRGWAIMLLYATGARIGSFVEVRAEDVRLGSEPSIVFAVTKGDRPYELPLNRKAEVAARHLLRCETSAHNMSGKVTLVGVGPERVRQWLEQAELDAGSIRHVHPHLLRHAFSNRVARAGDPEAWRRSMNHADLSQWTRYVGASDERVRQAVGEA